MKGDIKKMNEMKKVKEIKELEKKYGWNRLRYEGNENSMKLFSI